MSTRTVASMNAHCVSPFDVLEANTVSFNNLTWTVPAVGLYPHQWCWDSGFVALGWLGRDPKRAADELQALVAGQHENGMIPHIVFHDTDSSDASGPSRYFPGAEIWQCSSASGVATSGISQPPVAVVAAARLVRQNALAPAARSQAVELCQAMVRWLRWFGENRTSAHGRVFVVHPWESGWDDSPGFAQAFANVPATAASVAERHDIMFVDESMRPGDDDYRRFITLVEQLRAGGWSSSTFKVSDPGMTAVCAWAAKELAQACRAVGLGHADELDTLHELWLGGLRGLYALGSKGVAAAVDELSGQVQEPVAVAGLLGLLVGDNTSVGAVERWGQGMQAVVPTCDPEASRFDARRYWRGPSWPMATLLVKEGLNNCGFDQDASRLEQSVFNSVISHGFCEYFDPVTGEGLGASSFSATAAVCAWWMAQAKRR